MQKEKEGSIHHILAHSYLTYFIALIVGLWLDFKFPVRFLPKTLTSPLGLLVLFLSSLLILWAQRTSSYIRTKKEPMTAVDFRRGPYRFSRRPTNLGLIALVIGFGIMINSIFVIMATFLAIIITHYVFLHKEERKLEENYGELYTEYKKDVRPWL
jgi:protein-S-isoprenylcysteine O-methyltransferase Ste14